MPSICLMFQIGLDNFIALFDGQSSISNLEGKIFPVCFNIIKEPTFPSFLKLDTEEYPLYGSDGESFLSLLDIGNAVVFLTLNNHKWQFKRDALPYFFDNKK